MASLKIPVAYCVELDSYIPIGNVKNIFDPGSMTWRCKEDVSICSARISFRRGHYRLINGRNEWIRPSFSTVKGTRHSCGVINSSASSMETKLLKSMALPFIKDQALPIPTLLRSGIPSKTNYYHPRYNQHVFRSLPRFIDHLRNLHFDCGLGTSVDVVGYKCSLGSFYFPNNEVSFSRFLRLTSKKPFSGPKIDSRPIIVLEGVISSPLRFVEKSGKPYFFMRPLAASDLKLAVFFHVSDSEALKDAQIQSDVRVAIVFREFPHVKKDHKGNHYSINSTYRFSYFEHNL